MKMCKNFLFQQFSDTKNYNTLTWRKADLPPKFVDVKDKIICGVMFGLRFHVGAYIVKCSETETKELFKNVSKLLDILLTTKKKLL